MTQHSSSDGNNDRIGCSPETLLQIKDQRLQFAEHQADINMGAYLELKEQVAQMIKVRDDKISHLEKQLAKIDPNLGDTESPSA